MCNIDVRARPFEARRPRASKSCKPGWTRERARARWIHRHVVADGKGFCSARAASSLRGLAGPAMFNGVPFEGVVTSGLRLEGVATPGGVVALIE